MPEFRHAGRVDASPAEVFAWHGRPGAFERLVPPWERVEVVARDEPLLADGAGLVLRMGFAPGIWTSWEARHEDVVAADPAGGARFTDVQVRGPFRSWRHTHRFDPEGDGCTLSDEITWQPPGGAATSWAAEPVLEPRLRRMFRFRHRRLADDLERHGAFADQPRMTVAVSGATGLVGTALVPFLRSGGHFVRPMVRGRSTDAPPGDPEQPIRWSVAEQQIDQEALEGVDAVVHLAGAPIAGRRWSDDYKDVILRSREAGTRLLCEHLAKLRRKPRVLVVSSGVGFYGDGGDAELTEDSPTGDTFLAEVCRAWEAAAQPARDAGIRVVHLRTGIVIAANGGALAPMLPAFRAGLGGPIGDGRQYLPHVALEDMVGIIHQALFDERLEGPINATAPEPGTQGEFARTLGRVLGRPAILPAPAAALRLAMGRQMADELVVQGQRAVPARLAALGFKYRYPSLEDALRFELGLV